MAKSRRCLGLLAANFRESEDVDCNKGNKVSLIDSLPNNLVTREILSRLPFQTRSFCRCVCKLWNSSLITDFILILILSFLPVKSLLRFRSVSKLWLSIIDDPLFSRVHYSVSRRTAYEILLWDNVNEYFYTVNRLNGFLSRKMRLNAPYRNGGLRHKPAVVQSCRGLVLIAWKYHGLRVCNPATREFIEIPPFTIKVPHSQIMLSHQSFLALGFDKVNKKYKIVHMAYIPSESGMFNITNWGSKQNLECELYTLGCGSSSSWRRIGLVHFPLMASSHPVYSHCDGAIYFRTYCGNDMKNYKFVAFLVAKEKWQLVQQAGGPHAKEDYDCLTGLVNGRLLVSTFFSDKHGHHWFRSWEFRGLKSNKWKQHIMRTDFAQKLLSGALGIFNREEIIIPVQTGLLSYNLLTKTFRNMQFEDRPRYMYKITDYAETITPLE